MPLYEPVSSPDRLLRFSFPAAGVRGQIIRLEHGWTEVARRHRTHEAREVSPNLRQRLGELTAAGLLLSASLKFDGSLVLQIQSQGPVALFVVECENDARFRATVKIREGRRIMPDASLADLLGPLAQARFAVTLLPRSGTEGTGSLSAPYQGIVPFEGDTVAELLENYMARSEQVPTRLWLAADDEQAFGLLLQRMPRTGGIESPTNGLDGLDGFGGDEGVDDGVNANDDGERDASGVSEDGAIDARGARGAGDAGDAQGADDRHDRHADDDGWNRLVTLAETLTRAEMLELPVDTVLYRLFHETPPRVFGARAPRFVCNCSRHKVESMLRLLGPDEVASIVREQGLVEVRCEFCGEEYQLGADEAFSLFDRSGAGD